MAEQGNPAQTIERLLHYQFARSELLHEALTHRSALSRRPPKGKGRSGQQSKRSHTKGQGSNERLEFVGDRVLGLVMAEWLFERYPQEQEGALGARHAHLVSRPVLAEVADAISLADMLHIAQHEEAAGIRTLASVRADAMEALLGAIYLDGGLEPARRIVRQLWGKSIESGARPHKEPKTLLQEFLLGRGESLPRYEMVSSDGPSHAPVFCVQVQAMGHIGHGQAGSKRLAESAAAKDLLHKLGQEKKHA
ncbi:MULTISPECIES: ribonuclease III [unclassified Saccharibacter]|uniref:ribonuclease III n=1 Tax=unclassified Saccharibacter TaxID=2648722 RepID=UPI00132A0D0D|nr:MULTISPECIES: ribonuclease III [unclassified Saccharibacter]MXV36138.1 ribonuclease III [Saccharibacter sp. EH611]MXV56997.1 ribonuclease III [Saccharibacter sp. EH70]MXV66643.1 ribonuclease III [Saccharibacter sp. EH60]